jgi:hypothetical protein
MSIPAGLINESSYSAEVQHLLATWRMEVKARERQKNYTGQS